MRVLFLTLGGIGTASSRARVYNHLPTLRAAGIDAEVLQAPNGRQMFNPRQWQAMLRADTIVVQKVFLSPLLRAATRAMAKTRIYDIDDAMFAVPGYLLPAARDRSRMKRRTDRMLEWADIVLVANDYLATYARPRCRRLVVLGMGVDCERFSPPPPTLGIRKTGRPPVLGWVGAADARHFDNVRLLVDALRRLAARQPIIFRLVGFRDEARFVDLFRGIAGLTVETVGWRPTQDHVPGEIRSFDVGLAPLIDDGFTRGKSPIKLLEYMACGVVVVASRVGTQRELIIDGFNGFLASSTDEWVAKLERALAPTAENETIRQNALTTVRQEYSTKIRGDQLIEVLRQSRGPLSRAR